MATIGTRTRASGGRRSVTRRALLGVAAIALVVSAGCTGSDDSTEPDEPTAPTAPTESTEPSPIVVPGGECANEAATVEAAKPVWGRSTDVNGDRRADAIYLAKDPEGAPRCRRFLIVDTGDVMYSANASVVGYSELWGASVFRLLQLGGSRGHEIVVSTYGAVDSLVVYRLFTFHDGKLRPVADPYNMVVDDPNGHPVGAGCIPDGRFAISEASEASPNASRTVQRRFFALVADRLVPRGEQTRPLPPGAELDAAFREFELPLFGGC
jgi:hypothetical protein